MKNNNNIELITINGHKCAKITSITCHTDEGAMNFGFNYGDDTAAETTKVGERDFFDICDELFPDGWKNIKNVVSCVEDQAWGKKHLNCMDEFPHCCYKVEAEAFVYPESLCREVENKFGGPCLCWQLHKYEAWTELNEFYKEAFGHDIPYIPHCGYVPKGGIEERWASEHANINK